MNTVTLHCHAGNHEWERPSQRGRRPFNCPDCEPTEATPKVIVAKSYDYILDVAERAEEEEARKLRYCHAELSRGRELEDERLLLSVVKDISRSVR